MKIVIDTRPEKFEFLYHYTSVSALASILATGQIRFSSLTQVDDLDEVKTHDGIPYGKYCFVSCWTSTPNESIPMWHMYSDKLQGIRIKLPIFPFVEYENNKFQYSFIPQNEQCNDHCFIFPVNREDEMFLRPVMYTDDEEHLYPIVRKPDGISFNNNVGFCKRLAWSFQNEYRYKLVIFPYSYIERGKGDDQAKAQLERVINCEDLGFNYYYLKIREELLPDMEITLGPGIGTDSGEYLLIQALIDKYHLVRKPHLSSLFGRIRS